MPHGLPKWVIAGAFILALSAGMINAIILSAYTGDAVSHMTGNISNLAIKAIHGDINWKLLCFIIISFVSGAGLSGIIIGSESLKIGRRYGVALVIQSGILMVSWILFNAQQALGLYTTAMACGLQNAMVSTYSGATIRTTHMTGILSDLGSILGNIICRRPVNRAHALLLIDILSGFVSGVFTGAYLFTCFAMNTLFIPITLCFTSGIAYLLYRYYLFFTRRGIAARLDMEKNTITTN